MRSIGYCLMALLMLVASGTYAQSKTEAEIKAEKDILKQYAKADKLIKKNKTDKAVDVLQALTVKYPDYASPWEKLSMLQYRQYLKATESDGRFNIAIQGGDSTLNSLLMEMLKPSYRYKMAYLGNSSLGTARAWGAYQCVMLLRYEHQDRQIDADINPKAKELFTQAETEFAAKNYNAAAKYYQQAIDIDSNFYKAKLYLGDVYYMSKNYPQAITAFNAAIKAQPSELEPRKYLADALMFSESFQEAETVCKEAICVYPDQNMFARLGSSCRYNDKVFYNYWLERPMRPLYGKAKDYDMKEVKPEQAFWKPYYKAHEKIKDYLGAGDTLLPNALTKAKYLEVYAWEEMLKQSNAPELSYAKKMQAAGYLDCYVMITCFHDDFYKQFKHFAANNKERMLKYLDMQIESNN